MSDRLVMTELMNAIYRVRRGQSTAYIPRTKEEACLFVFFDALWQINIGDIEEYEKIISAQEWTPAFVGDLCRVKLDALRNKDRERVFREFQQLEAKARAHPGPHQLWLLEVLTMISTVGFYVSNFTEAYRANRAIYEVAFREREPVRYLDALLSLIDENFQKNRWDELRPYLNEVSQFESNFGIALPPHYQIDASVYLALVTDDLALLEALWTKLHEVSSTFTHKEHEILIRFALYLGFWHLGAWGSAQEVAGEMQRSVVLRGPHLHQEVLAEVRLLNNFRLHDYASAAAILQSLGDRPEGAVISPLLTCLKAELSARQGLALKIQPRQPVLFGLLLPYCAMAEQMLELRQQGASQERIDAAKKNRDKCLAQEACSSAREAWRFLIEAMAAAGQIDSIAVELKGLIQYCVQHRFEFDAQKFRYLLGYLNSPTRKAPESGSGANPAEAAAINLVRLWPWNTIIGEGSQVDEHKQNIIERIQRDLLDSPLLCRLLMVFLGNKAVHFSSEALFEKVWREPWDPSRHSHRLYQLIRQARRYLQDAGHSEQIIASYGEGYSLQDPTEKTKSRDLRAEKRLEKLLEHFNKAEEHEFFTSQFFAKLYGISERQARRDLEALLTQGLIQVTNTGRQKRFQKEPKRRKLCG